MFMTYRLFHRITKLMYNFDQRETNIAADHGGCFPMSTLTSTSTHCPGCGSNRVGSKNWGRKSAGTVGALAGAYSGAAAALGGAEAGAAIGMFAGPIGAAAGGVAGAIFGALFGSAVGGAMGATLGESVDTNILDNYQCLDCRHSFSA